MKHSFIEGQRVCEKVGNVISWGVIAYISKRKADGAVIYYVRWDDNYGGYRDEQDLIPLGEPDDCLKELL